MRMTPHFEPHPMFCNKDALPDRACEEDPHATPDGSSSLASPALAGEVSASADGGGLPNHQPHPRSFPAPAGEVGSAQPRSEGPLPNHHPHPLASPGLPGEVPTKSAEGALPNHQPYPRSFPAPAGEVARQSRVGGGSPSSSPTPFPPDGRSLMADRFFQDLLDPTNTPLQICLIHDITLDQLETIVTSTAFKRAAAQLQTITSARTEAIDSNTHLQTQSLNRAIANDAYLAATDMDQAATARDPKRAAIKARFLETARKANTPLGARTRDKAAQCCQTPDASHSSASPSHATPAPAEEGAERNETARVSYSPSPASSPGHPGEVSAPVGRRGSSQPPSTPALLPRPSGGGGLGAAEVGGGSPQPPSTSTRLPRASGGGVRLRRTEGLSPTTIHIHSPPPGFRGRCPPPAVGGGSPQPPSTPTHLPRASGGGVRLRRTEGALPTTIHTHSPPPGFRGRCPPPADGGGLPQPPTTPKPHPPSNTIRYCS